MWQHTSRRRAELPANWQALRTHILRRDAYTCTLRRAGCTHHATDVHHTHNGDTHDPQYLTAACHHCHMAVTALQSHATRPSRKRKGEPHPGLLGGVPQHAEPRDRTV